MYDRKKVGRRLRWLRQKNHMTQENVSRLLCCSRKACSGYENGHAVPSDVVYDLSVLYGVTADFILGLDDTQERKSRIEEKVRYLLLRMARDSEERDTGTEGLLEEICDMVAAESREYMEAAIRIEKDIGPYMEAQKMSCEVRDTVREYIYGKVADSQMTFLELGMKFGIRIAAGAMESGNGISSSRQEVLKKDGRKDYSDSNTDSGIGSD